MSFVIPSQNHSLEKVLPPGLNLQIKVLQVMFG